MSSDLCHKKMLLESLNIPLNQLGEGLQEKHKPTSEKLPPHHPTQPRDPI